MVVVMFVCFGYGLMFGRFGYSMMFERFDYGMKIGWCYMFFGCFGYILMSCLGHMHFECLDNSHFIGDGMGGTLGIVVVCLTYFDCGFVCLWVGNFVG